jgi:hypothetical protein
MDRIARALLAGWLVLAATSVAAQAAELTTTRLYRNGGQGLRCAATNVGTKTMALVHITLVQTDGTEVGPNDCTELGPNVTCETSSEAVPGAFCRISFKGSAKQIRAALRAGRS